MGLKMITFTLMDWQSFAKPLAEQGIFLAAAGWLIKAILSNRMQSEVDKFKINLQSQADLEIERLKTSLAMTAKEHEVRFSKLHEKQAEVIAELYALIVGTLMDLNHYSAYKVDDYSGATKSAANKVQSLFLFVTLHKLYFPPHVQTMLVKFGQELNKLRSRIDSMQLQDDKERGGWSTPEQGFKEMLETVKVMERDIPTLMTALEKEFQMLLGISDTPART
jgi:hypothetical protein